MHRPIWLNQAHIPVSLSRFGFSVLLTGLAGSDRTTIGAVSLALKQEHLQLDPKSLLFRAGLSAPKLAQQALGHFSENFDKGIAIAATFPRDERLHPGLASLEATVSWTDGCKQTSRLATISLQLINPLEFAVPIGADTVGIALATYNPNLSLFRNQIESIRAQSHTDWVCAISDDRSAPALLDEMRAILGADPRFALSVAPTNAGVYRNFERAIGHLPEGCGWIAFADQDDEWLPPKLEVLVREAKRTQSTVVFSDMEIYSDGGQRLANTFWIHRRLESQNPTSIAVANTVTGMAMLARSSVLSTAMPFPGLPGTAYHDRWLTLAGLAQGKLHYVDQALVRYVQHAGNHTGIEKRSAGIVMLTFRFLKCLTECGLAALRPSLRTALPARLEPCSHWSSVESLSLSLQIETLQQRLPRQLWQPKVWDHFNKLLGHPTSALFNVSLKSLLDPYRRHMLVGLALGSLFHSLTSFVLRCATALRRVRSSSRDVKA